MNSLRKFLLCFCACLPVLAGAPTIVFVSGEYEYKSKETLPVFARELAKKYDVKTVMLARPEDPKRETIPGLEALDKADLVVLFIRRMTLPETELQKFKKYVESGKPVVGIRTASHSFQNWKEFDRDVLGGNYHNHHGNKLKTTVSLVPETAGHPILRGVTGFISDGSLYRNTPLREGTTMLLRGKVEGFPPEPVAWTHTRNGARVFYTSLGHPNDFKEESFVNLLENGISWALNQPLERREK